MSSRSARHFHGLTSAVAFAALVLQLVQVCRGTVILDQTSGSPGLVTRLVRYASYLTIWSNALVAWSTLTLALGRDRDTRVWRALRLDALLLCFGGGVLHFFFLRPLLHLHGLDALADHLLHQVVPLLAVIGFVAFGPRGRIAWSDLGPTLVVPAVWILYTLVRGAFVHWYPYPFVNVDRHGYAVVAMNLVGIAVFVTVLFAAARLYDGRAALR